MSTHKVESTSPLGFRGDVRVVATITRALVHPSDLEVSWETTYDGHAYYWVQVKAGAEKVHEVESKKAFDCSFAEAKKMVKRELTYREDDQADGMIEVVRVNITERGGMNFLTTTMSPLDEIKRTLGA